MEIWKPLKKFPNYEGSTEGRIKNVRTQRILTPVIDENGYAKVTLRKNGKQYTVRVSRAIADTFLEDDSKLDVGYKNHDRSKNQVDNLKRCTRKEIISDAYKRGTKRARNYTKIRVVETGDIFDSILDCAKVLDCDRSAISKCLAGKLKTVKGYRFEKV